MICVSVMAGSNHEAIRMMKRGFALADMVELRLDRIVRPALPALIKAREGTLLVTNRRKEEGGFFEGSEKDRVGLLAQAANLGADYLDVEAGTGKQGIGRLKAEIGAKATRMIVSHHDFQRTPPWNGLVRRLDACRAYGAHAVKIVTLARSMEDNIRLMRIIPRSLAQGQPIIAFCMGPLGRVSRILAPLLGSFLTYVSLRKGAESAPGQFTVGEMRKIMGLLGFEDSRIRRPLGAGSSRASRQAKPEGERLRPGQQS
ncbi:MAG: type I 3-dehydroquinate dehydratase [Syntrophaceae bacterium]|nr:type I 3-dehydroquinate dehydratase [Syntrophaceae bacterium]